MARTGYGFDDLTNGATIPTGGSNFWTTASINTPQTILASTAAGVDGMGVRVTNNQNGLATFLERTWTAVPAISVALHMRQPQPPTSGQQRLFALRVGTTEVVRFDHNSDGRILLRGTNGTTITAASQAANEVQTVGTPLVCQVYVNKDGRLRVRFAVAGGSQLRDSGTLTGQAVTTGDFNSLRIGWVLSSNAGVTHVDFDSIHIEDNPAAGELIDPYVTPASAPPSVYYATGATTSVPAEMYYATSASTSVRVDIA